MHCLVPLLRGDDSVGRQQAMVNLGLYTSNAIMVYRCHFRMALSGAREYTMFGDQGVVALVRELGLITV
jgi:hypothetical protein